MKKICFLIISLVIVTACADSGLDEVNKNKEISMIELLCQDWGSSASYVKSRMTSFGILSENSDVLLFKGDGDSKIAYGFVSDSLVSACIIYDHLVDEDKLGLSTYSYIGIVDECDVYQGKESFVFVFEMAADDGTCSIVGMAPKTSTVLPDYIPISIASKKIDVTGYNTTTILFKTTGLTENATALIKYSLEPDLKSPSSMKVTVGENGEGKFDLSSLKMNKKYYAMLFVTADNLTYTGDYLNFTTLNAEEGNTNGYKWINLGLPSGTLWATKDVGASAEGEYGKYYAWGCIYTTTNYGYDDYKYFDGVFYGNVQYTNIGYEISGNKKYDVATYLWDSPWRMPNRTECEELVKYCSSEEFGTYFKITGPNGKHIIFPKSGYARDVSRYSGDSYSIWTSTLETNNCPYEMSIYSGTLLKVYSAASYAMPSRHEGHVIRPVLSL